MIRAIILGVALSIAAPAAAQTGQLPLWMVGKWCMVREEIEVCARYDPPEGGAMRGTSTITRNGETRQTSMSLTRVENGVLVKRSLDDTLLLREVPHGPDEWVFESARSGPNMARRNRVTVSGDTMTVEFTVDGQAPAVQRYRRVPDI